MGDLAYRINLNKASNRLDQFEQQQKRRKAITLGFFLFLLVGVTVVAVVFALRTQSRINGYEEELTKIDNDIKQLEASAEYLSPEDIFALSQLADKRLTWTEKLNVLGRIMPKDVAITELYYDYQVKTLRIKGISKIKAHTRDLDLVMSIVNLIKENQDFSKDFVDIRFSSSTKVKRHGQDLIEFEIECLVG
jgi:Tfp pilus assembly protein PilN